MAEKISKDEKLLAAGKIKSGTPIQQGYYWHIMWELKNGKPMLSTLFFTNMKQAEDYIKGHL